MLHRNSTLKLYEALGRARPDRALSEGMRVGRGFADIGYEEFIILPSNKILSLLTGTTTSLDQVKREHLFEIPTVDQLIADIHTHEFTVGDVELIDNREWQVSVMHRGTGEKIVVTSPSLEGCFLRINLALNHVELSKEERCLKTVMANQ